MTKKKIMIETDIEKKQRKQKKQTELDKAIKKEKLELIGCNKPQKSMSIFITNQKDRFINKIDDNLEEREYKVLIKKGRTDIIQEKEQEKLMRKMTKKERAEKIKREIEESKDYNLYSWEDIWGLRSDKLYDPKLLCKSLLDSKAITKDKYNQLLDDFKNYFFEKMDPIQNKEEDMLIIQKDKNGDNIYSYVQGKEQNHIIRQAYEYNLCLSVKIRDIISDEESRTFSSFSERNMKGEFQKIIWAHFSELEAFENGKLKQISHLNNRSIHSNLKLYESIKEKLYRYQITINIYKNLHRIIQNFRERNTSISIDSKTLYIYETYTTDANKLLEQLKQIVKEYKIDIPNELVPTIDSDKDDFCLFIDHLNSTYSDTKVILHYNKPKEVENFINNDDLYHEYIKFSHSDISKNKFLEEFGSVTVNEGVEVHNTYLLDLSRELKDDNIDPNIKYKLRVNIKKVKERGYNLPLILKY